MFYKVTHYHFNFTIIFIIISQVSDACHSVAQSAQQKFLSYKYEPGKSSGRALTVCPC